MDFFNFQNRLFIMDFQNGLFKNGLFKNGLFKMDMFKIHVFLNGF